MSWVLLISEVGVAETFPYRQISFKVFDIKSDQEIQERVASVVPADWKSDKKFMGHVAPRTMEEYYYRSLFNTYYGPLYEKATVPYRWMPRWSPETTDPSARTLNIYS